MVVVEISKKKKFKIWKNNSENNAKRDYLPCQ